VKVGLDSFGEEKNPVLLLGFEPLSVQPVASRYIDYTNSVEN
jgi:hypothetical protein